MKTYAGGITEEDIENICNYESYGWEQEDTKYCFYKDIIKEIDGHYYQIHLVAYGDIENVMEVAWGRTEVYEVKPVEVTRIEYVRVKPEGV